VYVKYFLAKYGMIYKITNTLNNKAYIGYSSNVHRRWQEHSLGHGSKLVYAAICKYGIENLAFEIIADGTVENEDSYIQEHNTMAPIGYNLVEGGGLPPNKNGWHPSANTLKKRSASLKGINRTDEWRERLSASKTGAKNPRYGIKEDSAITENRVKAAMLTKHTPNYDRYKDAIELMNNGVSADTVSKQFNIGRGVCFKLKNRSHGFFECFPELI
jgi:group I intron endonuclease